jgi:hypothetical protein
LPLSFIGDDFERAIAKTDDTAAIISHRVHRDETIYNIDRVKRFAIAHSKPSRINYACTDLSLDMFITNL